MSDQGESAADEHSAEEGYPVGPADQEVVDREPAEAPFYRTELPEAGSPDAGPDDAERFQFSLAELLWLVAAASVFMSIVGLLPGGYEIQTFAGVAGFAALLGMLVLALLKPQRAIFRLAWWVMLVGYLLACIAAYVAG